MSFYTYPDRILLDNGVRELGTMKYTASHGSTNFTDMHPRSWYTSNMPQLSFGVYGYSCKDVLDAAYSDAGAWKKIFTLKNGSSLVVSWFQGIGSYLLTYMDKNGNVSSNYWDPFVFYDNYKSHPQTYPNYQNMAIFIFFILDNNGYWGFGSITSGVNNNQTEYDIEWNVNNSTNTLLNAMFTGQILELDDPYMLDENQTPDGGFGGFDYTGDDIDIPALPAISAGNSGFVRLYNPTITEVQDLADYLWAGAFDIATYKKLFGNPMDCFLSFGIIPVTPSRSTNKENISFANMPDPGVTAYKVTDQFAELDCGSVTIDGSKYTKSAMDYSPYTRAEIFLPFCGTHSLSVDEIMDATINVVYHMDLYTGACVAYVKITKTNSDGSTLDSVLYQFTGNILATIPLTGADHSSFIQSILFMGAAAAATVATAGAAAPEIGGAMAAGDAVSTSALGGAAISASGINAVMSMKPNVIRSGNLSANAGFLGLKKPVITLTLPNLCRPGDEEKLAGMPCQKSGTLSEFTGFNIVSACHLNNIPCTMEELRMIDEALAKGVIL